MQDARAVANYFLDLAEREGETLSAMKLQKLIYFAHGWTLALNREPLINEPIEAWEYGPVIPSVYREFKKFGSGPITDRSVVATSDPDDPYSLIAVPRGIPEREASTRKFLDAIWNAYKGYSAVQLSNLTHLPGTPWEKVYRGSSRNKPIPNEEIQRYFESQSQPQ